MLAKFVAGLIVGFARFITAVRGRWEGIEPVDAQRVYFANHASHGDFILIWTVLPPRLRRRTRPVAGADYWLKGQLRRFIGRDVFNAVLIDRQRENRTDDPVALMTAALDGGASLIVFPEGTRNTGEAPLLPFKSGLYHLARARPDLDLVPVWIDNLNRVMPKGEIVPDSADLHRHLRCADPCRRDARQGRIHRERAGRAACAVTQGSRARARAMSAPHSDLLTLLAGLAAVLVAASAIGYVLQRRLSPDGSNAAIENLNDRIRAWWVMVALMGLALHRRAHRRDPAFRLLLVRGAARVRDAHQHAPGRSLGAGGCLLHRPAGRSTI